MRTPQAAEKTELAAGQVGRSRAPLHQTGLGFLILLYFLFAGAGHPAQAFDFSGVWTYNQSGTENAASTYSFDQLYKVSDGISLDLTDAISAKAGISYEWHKRTDINYKDTLSPSAGLKVNNDIFNTSFNATATRVRNANGREEKFSSWRTNLSPGSFFFRNFWPTLNLYYGQSRYESSTPGSSSFESKNYDYGANVGLDLHVAKLTYTYNNIVTRNLNAQSRNETATHTARLFTSGNFFKDHLNVKLTQTVTNETDEISGVILPTSKSDPINLRLTTYAREEQDNVVQVDPITGVPKFDDHEIALDNYEGSSATIIPRGDAPGNIWHLGVGGVFCTAEPTCINESEQQVSQLDINVKDQNVDDPQKNLETFLADHPNALQWQLYVSEDNSHWVPVPGYGDMNVDYDPVEQRFVLDIPDLLAMGLNSSYQYLKILVTNLTDENDPLNNVTVDVTSIEAFAIIEGRPGSHYSIESSGSSYNSNINMGLDITSTLRASSNIKLLYFSGYYNEVVNANLHWLPSPLFSPTLNFYQNRTTKENSEDILRRTYGISTPITLMPTLNFALGVTRTEHFSGSQRNYVSDSYLLNSTAILYPDLTATLTTAYSTGSQTQSQTLVERKSMNTHISLDARFTSKLTGDLSHTYSRVYKPNDMSESITSLKADYRPSNLLAFSLALDKKWTGDAGSSRKFSMDLALLRTRKTRVNFSYDYIQTAGQENGRNNFNVNSSWDISRLLTLKSHAGYTMASTNSWSFYARLYMKL